jgi:hypothetical protein
LKSSQCNGSAHALFEWKQWDTVGSNNPQTSKIGKREQNRPLDSAGIVFSRSVSSSGSCAQDMGNKLLTPCYNKLEHPKTKIRNPNALQLDGVE